MNDLDTKPATQPAQQSEPTADKSVVPPAKKVVLPERPELATRPAREAQFEDRVTSITFKVGNAPDGSTLPYCDRPIPRAVNDRDISALPPEVRARILAAGDVVVESHYSFSFAGKPSRDSQLFVTRCDEKIVWTEDCGKKHCSVSLPSLEGATKAGSIGTLPRGNGRETTLHFVREDTRREFEQSSCKDMRVQCKGDLHTEYRGEKTYRYEVSGPAVPTGKAIVMSLRQVAD